MHTLLRRMNGPKVPRRIAVLCLAGLVVFVLLLHVANKGGVASSLSWVLAHRALIGRLTGADTGVAPSQKPTMGVQGAGGQLPRLSRSRL